MAGQTDDRKDAAAPEVEMPIEDVRRGLADLVGQANYAGARIVVTKHGKRVAALVSIPDLERLRALEPATAVNS